ncbi:MAG: PAT family beta-lactamase induction signal transducer AmpG [Candidatus Azotimanducaceae bacterium]|jgi:PAT family beta-lactamase induction signal transducer AmpG
MLDQNKKENPWRWVPSLYFAEGLPYIIVMSLSVIMYKRLGISNIDIALYTSWLYLPWVIKPFWSPFVESFSTKRHWILLCQLLIGAGFGGIALTIQMDNFFQYSLALFWLLAFSSATHDIAADGFYILSLNKHHQTWFVGIRSTFYRGAVIFGQGILIIIAGYVESHTGLPPIQIEISSTTSANSARLEISAPIQKDEQKLLAHPSRLEIQILNKQDGQMLVNQAQEWNINHQFINGQRFDKRNDAKILNGNIGILRLRLALPLEKGKTIRASISHEGNKDIKLLGPELITFTHKNWNQDVMVLVQLDPNLKEISHANLIVRAGNIALAWSLTLLLACSLFTLLVIYHFFALPKNEVTIQKTRDSFLVVLKGMNNIFLSFFQRKGILSILAFLLLYRFSEAQLLKLAAPFLLDSRSTGGLQMSTGEVGWAYGTAGILALTIGGLCGGFVAAKQGLRAWLWPMALAINIPNIVYYLLATYTPTDLLIINTAIFIEQFGYGFGFSAYLLFMISIASGKHATAHFAIGTGFMALGMMLPGMISGWIQDSLGYQQFFGWVMLATIPSLIVTSFISVDSEFGNKL